MKLHRGDCLEIMKDIPDKSIDLILCDLPYGTTDCKWDSIIPFEALWAEYHRIIKDNAAIVLFAAQPFTTKLINSNFKYYRYNWYWKKANKTGALFAKSQPMRCIEDICIFYKHKPTYNPQGLIKLDSPIITAPIKSNIYGDKKNNSVQTHKGYPTHLLEFKKDPHAVHPTQKPVQLLEYLIKTYSRPRRARA